MGEKERVDAYLDTISRIEPDVAMIDASAFYASAAISLKRMADAAERSASAQERIATFLEGWTCDGGIPMVKVL